MKATKITYDFILRDIEDKDELYKIKVKVSYALKGLVNKLITDQITNPKI